MNIKNYFKTEFTPQEIQDEDVSKRREMEIRMGIHNLVSGKENSKVTNYPIMKGRLQNIIKEVVQESWDIKRFNISLIPTSVLAFMEEAMESDSFQDFDVFHSVKTGDYFIIGIICDFLASLEDGEFLRDRDNNILKGTKEFLASQNEPIKFYTREFNQSQYLICQWRDAENVSTFEELRDFAKLSLENKHIPLAEQAVTIAENRRDNLPNLIEKYLNGEIGSYELK